MMNDTNLLKKSILLLFAVTCSLFLATGLALAQEPDYDRINEVAGKLNCPTCAGLNLADCRTQTCAQWRGRIGDLIEAGYTDQEILDDFVTRYGEQVLQAPPKSGFTLVLWVLPFIILLAGGVWLYYTLRGWTKPEPASAAAVATMPAGVSSTPVPTNSTDSADDYLKQVEKDLGLDERK